MVVVGGIGSVWGAIGGAIVFGLIAELLRQVPSYQEVIYGCILMLFMMYLPRGVFSLIRPALRDRRDEHSPYRDRGHHRPLRRPHGRQPVLDGGRSEGRSTR